MPEYLSPGVYIEEVNTGPRPIEGVGTAMAAFVGFAPSGPANTPTLVTNWSQYVDTFGAPEPGGRRNPHLDGAYLSHAVYGYFNNGGGRCYVVRVVPADGKPEPAKLGSGAQLALPSRSSKGTASISAAPKGTPAGDISVEVGPATGEDAGEGAFTLKVKAGDVEETFENVSLGRGKGAKNVIDTVNQQSKVITLTETQTTGSLLDRSPALGSYTLALKDVTAITTTSASSLRVKSAHFVGDVSQRTGLEGLEVQEDVTMVACPDLMSAFQAGQLDADGVKAVQLAMISHCERMKNRMAIIDPLPGLTPQQVKKWREKDTNYDSHFAATYYPWLKIDGPDSKPIEVPASGHMAGIWARSDNERGVHKAPANEVVRGALGPAAEITKGEQDTLNPIGVNCIRTFTGRGVRAWGARTLSSDPAWRYISVRRLFNYVEESIERGTQWVVFEPNDQNLWARVTRDVSAFLTGVWRDGALFGLTPQQAFFVKCDEELNPADVRDRGQLVIEVGMAPVKPAEFVIFRFSQYAGGGA
jgi:phage tail sheath protein FI